jgi:hypothetical protein
LRLIRLTVKKRSKKSKCQIPNAKGRIGSI